MEEFKAQGVCSVKAVLNKTGLECLQRIKDHYKFYDELKVSNSDVMNVALIYLDECLQKNPRRKTVR